MGVPHLFLNQTLDHIPQFLDLLVIPPLFTLPLRLLSHPVAQLQHASQSLDLSVLKLSLPTLSPGLPLELPVEPHLILV